MKTSIPFDKWCKENNSELLCEWHPTKNEDLKPSMVSAGSTKRIWWLGSCGHEWDATVGNRTNNHSGCPYCSSTKVLQGFNDLLTKDPNVASEWHPTKNGDLKPSMISAGSSKKVWWLDKYGHEWYATVKGRTIGGNGCPYCRNFYALEGYNDLATTHPTVAKEWHPTKNGSLHPTDVTSGSSTIVWWLGSCGHEWEMTVRAKVHADVACPYCRGKLLKGFNDLESTYPEIAKEWHPTKNGNVLPSEITKNSQKKFWWIGPCGHEFYTQVYQRTAYGRGCPYCSRLILSGFNDFQTKNPEVASEWHPTKNGSLSPSDVGPGDPITVWWLGKCGHEWKTSVNARNRGTKCPYCQNSKLLPGFNDLKTLNPDLAAEWHPTRNDPLDPSDVFCGSNKKVWWLGKCGHEWQATVSARRVNGCPICTNKVFVPGINDFRSLEPELSKEWHPTKNADLTPESVKVTYDHEIWWLGECGHEWKETPRYRHYHRTGCPTCLRESRTSFNEQALYYYIKKEFPDAISSYWPECLEGKELDIFIPSLKTAIEYDGCAFHKNTKRDELKADLCAKNGIDLIRIREPKCPQLSNSVHCINVSTEKENAILESLHYLEKIFSQKTNN